MILSDMEIKWACEEYDLVTPYNPECINPASIDLRLGRRFINQSPNNTIRYWFEGKRLSATFGEEFEADAVEMSEGISILASTLEYIKLPSSWWGFKETYDDYPPLAGQLALKSTAARKGLDHSLAGWVDPGFEGELTLEFHAHRSIELISGDRYVQLVLMKMSKAPNKPYSQTGRYQGQVGPTCAR